MDVLEHEHDWLTFRELANDLRDGGHVSTLQDRRVALNKVLLALAERHGQKVGEIGRDVCRVSSEQGL